MIKRIVAGLLMAGLVSGVAQTSESGFVPLFNGKDLSGWDGNPSLWKVEQGAIVGRTTAEAPIKANTFLICTNVNAANFELRCSFKLEANNDKTFANSGIQYRSAVLDPAGWRVGGYQADMEAGPNYTGILYEEGMTRGIMAMRGEKVTWTDACKKEVTGETTKPVEIEAGIRKNAWNEYRIVARGNHLQHFVNGKLTVDVTDNCVEKRATNGVFALQLHAGEPMTASFKNIQLKKLP
jgi:hypothetical protein